MFILRFKPATAQTTTNMAEHPQLNRNTKIQYRRKPPSSIRRDQQRMKQHQKQLQQGMEKAAFNESLDVPLLFNEEECEPTQLIENDTEQQSDHVTGGEALLDNTEAPHDLAEIETVTSLLSLEHPATEPVFDDMVGECSSSVVKEYVSGLTDRSVQRRLRDRERNTSFRRITTHRAENDQEVCCLESDDLVVEFACPTDSGDSKFIFWYVKQEEKNMTEDERRRLANLRGGKRVADRGKHADIIARASREMDTLRSLIQFFLG